MLHSLRQHWPEYLMEAWGLGFFMLSACLCIALFAHPASPLAGIIRSPFARRVWIGAAMGLTAIVIIYSPWGRRSGAHINPAVTLTFLRLGKIAAADALFYVAAQFAGGLAGVLLSWLILRSAIAHPTVAYAVTVPGPRGPLLAFAAETGIAFLTMTVVLISTNVSVLAPKTGLFVGGLVACYVIFESPLSGFGMNPARTVASALPAGNWNSIWVYFSAPLLGMLLAAEAHSLARHARPVLCAKLVHDNHSRCIFLCGACRGRDAQDTVAAPVPDRRD